MSIWSSGVNALLQRMPRNCALCGQRALGMDLCVGCQQHLLALQPPFSCPLCALPVPQPGRCVGCRAQPPVWSAAVAAVPWCAPIDGLILECKRGNRFGRARLLADLLAGAWPAWALEPPVRAVPIPASRAALVRRGFNPAGEITRFLAARQGWQRQPGVLRWQGDHGSHTLRGSSARARREQRRGALLAQPRGSMELGTWVVVDDVMTTGSTLKAATLALQAVGARCVIVAAVARTPPPDLGGFL